MCSETYKTITKAIFLHIYILYVKEMGLSNCLDSFLFI